MKDFFKGFFRENSPESMTRLNMFWAGVTVNLMCLLTLLMFWLSDGKLDFSSQCALLSSIVLGLAVGTKTFQKGKEVPSLNQ